MIKLRTAVGSLIATTILGSTQLVVAQASAAQTLDPNPEAESARSMEIGEIIVTAQRRAENLQDVPIAVSAVSAEQLTQAGVTDLESLGVVVPGLSFNSIQQNVQPRLRGIGTSSAGPGIESTVAIYVDGVYYASATGALFSFNNIEQISVLKGPQGTLFGRNAVAGLVQVTTRDPVKEPTFESTVGYGNYQTVSSSFYVSTGIGDDLAVDFAFTGETMGDGYGRNLTLGRDTKQTDHDINLRSKLVWTPTDTTKATLSLDYTNMEGTMGTNRLEPGSIPGVGTGPNIDASVWDVTADIEGFNDNESGGVSLKVDQEIGTLNFMSLTAYRELKYDNQLDLDFTATPSQGIRQSQSDRQFSQEFQLQSPSTGPFEWTFGLYYFDANAVSNPLIVNLYGDSVNPFFPLNQIVTTGAQQTQSIAGYGQASYTFPSETTITLGARYTSEERTADTDQVLRFAGGAPDLVLPSTHQSETFRKPTYRVAVDQKVGEDTLVYASFNRGFKSGGFNAQQLHGAKFEPEVLDAYETGFKTSLFDRAMTLNASAFYYDYTDIQIQKINADGSLGTINGAEARVYGLDIDAAANVSQSLQLTLGLAFLDTEFLDFPGAIISSPEGGVPTTVGSAKGNELPLAPEFTGSLGANYTLAMSGGSSLTANGTLAYNSGWYTEPDNFVEQDRFAQFNARLTWTSADEHYSVALWGENLNNVEARSNAGTTANGSHYVSYAPPRTYGVTFGIKY